MKYVLILFCVAAVCIAIYLGHRPERSGSAPSLENTFSISQDLNLPTPEGGYSSDTAEKESQPELKRFEAKDNSDVIVINDLAGKGGEETKDDNGERLKGSIELSEQEDIYQPPPLPDAEVLRAVLAAEKESLNELQDKFDAESFDENWGGDLESQFYQNLSHIDNNLSSVTKAECRTSMCQFDVSHFDLQAQNMFLKNMLQKFKSNFNLYQGSLFRYQDENEQFRTTYFLYREGMDQD